MPERSFAAWIRVTETGITWTGDVVDRGEDSLIVASPVKNLARNRRLRAYVVQRPPGDVETLDIERSRRAIPSTESNLSSSMAAPGSVKTCAWQPPKVAAKVSMAINCLRAYRLNP